MAKIMLFIDGTWLYRNLPKLGQAYGQQDYKVDFGRLPRILAGKVASDLGATDVDIVRTYLFGSYPANHDVLDDDIAQRSRDFFDMLKEEHHYEVEVYPINYRGRRVRRDDRDQTDPFQPQEKCVDVSLATSMLYFAAIPYAYDIAIAVVGDQDFKPVLQHVRRLGKRVAIASIKRSCPQEFADPRDPERLKDFDIIWLDELLDDLELKWERHQLQCQAPAHRGDRTVWTTFHPRRGQKFYCPECRAESARQKQDALQEFVGAEIEATTPADGSELVAAGQTLSGVVKKKVEERGFGFILGADNREYFFHLTDLRGGLEFENVAEGLQVDFEVKNQPSSEKAGAAQNVRSRVPSVNVGSD